MAGHVLLMEFVVCKDFNMKKYICTLLIAILAGGFCVSCVEDDSFSSDSKLLLTFSQDTISFDTVFAEVGSSVSQFKIYNRNDKSLNIESIELVNPEESGFSLNIDGFSGISHEDVTILRKDSLFGFVRITVNPLKVNSATLIRDSIRFVTNGNIQYIILEAIGRNVVRISNLTVDKDMTLEAELPYLIYGDMSVAENATLTIAEGAELYFHENASLRVAGRLIALGSVDNRIVMRGDRMDKMHGTIPYDNIPGQWQGVMFEGSSINNQLENVVVKNAVVGLDFKSSSSEQLKASLYNVKVHNSSEYGLLTNNSKIKAVNCLFSNARKSVVSIDGGVSEFLHCTLVNYYDWSMREGATLNVNEEMRDGGLNKYEFKNSIIYGSMQNELNIGNSEMGNVIFQSCLIRNKQEFDRDSFVKVIWNKEPSFLSINENGLYEYDFMLTDKSAAKDAADIVLASEVPDDLNGVSRVGDTSPDIGCFEYTFK